MFKYMISMSRRSKGLIMLMCDIVLIFFSVFIAYTLRLNDPWPIDWFFRSYELVAAMMAAAILFTFVLRLHLTKLGGFDFRSAADMGLWVLLVSITGFLANLLFGFGAPRTVPIISGALLFMLVFGFRFFALNLIRTIELGNVNRIPVAVYGAGAAGHQLIGTLRSSKEYKPALFIDDNPHLHGLNISGLRVYKPEKLKRLVARGKVEKVFLAIPSITAAQRRRLNQSLSEIGCEVQEVPSYEEVIESGDILKSLRVVQPEALLGRDDVDVRMAETDQVYNGANVLVSGGGGSIGSELCRKILESKPAKLVILEISEFALYKIERELLPVAEKSDCELVAVLGSVGNSDLLMRLYTENDIQIVLHAAAYKHVPLVEENILEGITNNVFGTKTIAETAIACGVKRFTLVSTDKAVRPTSVMGATKRVAELILQDMHTISGDCIFSIVRFGNVLGSSGSVIPLFKEQIEQGGPILVTHQDITRYFMTIPEAARLVLLASSLADGGEVFVLDMGKPVKILELAHRMVELSGYTVRNDRNPDGDIEIKITSLRPGEKLYEELLIGENTLPTPHPKILRAKEGILPSQELMSLYEGLQKSYRTQNVIRAKELLFEAVERSEKTVSYENMLKANA